MAAFCTMALRKENLDAKLQATNVRLNIALPFLLLPPSILSCKELRDISGSYDRLDELHAAGKLWKQQLLYFNFPLEPDVPRETCHVFRREPVIRDAVTADSDDQDDWVSELLQSVADVSDFSI